MTIKHVVKYEKSYTEKEVEFETEITEASMNELRLAFEDTSCGKKEKYYYYDFGLWVKGDIRDIHCEDKGIKDCKTTLEALKYWAVHGEKIYLGDNGRADRIHSRFENMMKCCLVVDGELYMKCAGTPAYAVMLIPKSNGRIGTCFYIAYVSSKAEIDNDIYFDLNHAKEAVAKAKAVAEQNKDYESINSFKPLANVYMPELF